MSYFRNVTLSLSATLLYCSVTIAQQYVLKESTANLKGPQHEILSGPGGDYISITYPFADDKDPVIVSRWDRSLNAKYSSSLSELSKEHYRASVYGNGRLFLLCSDKDGAVNRYEVNDKTGALTGSATGLFALTGKEEDATFFSGSAPGSSFHYAIAQVHEKKEKGMTLEGVIMDQQCNKTGVFSFTTPEDRDDFEHLDVLQADNGALYLIYNVAAKTSKDDYTPFVYTIVTVDPNGKTGSFALTGLPAGDLRNISWAIRDNGLVFTGFLAHTKKSGYTTIVTGSLDPLQKKIGNLQQTEIASLMTQMPDYVKDMKSIPIDVRLLRSAALPDGSKALVLEANGGSTYQSHYAPIASSNPANNMPTTASGRMLNSGMMSSYSINYFNRGYVFLLKVDKANTPQWLDVISKNQQEPDVVLSTGTAFTTDSKGDIDLFFVDNQKNADPVEKSPIQVSGRDYKKNMLACVTVTPAGVMTKKFLDQEDPEFRPMLEHAVSETNVVSLMAIKTKTAMSVTHLLNHADYRIATIAVK
jgi:hypothetical protein